MTRTLTALINTASATYTDGITPAAWHKAALARAV